MSDNFQNIQTHSLPNSMVGDPNGTGAKDQSAGGATKIRPQGDDSMKSIQYSGNEKGIGTETYEPASGDSGFNISAGPTPITFGDPNHTAGH